MDKRQKGYEAFIAELQKQWQETEEFQGERLNRMIAKVQAYLRQQVTSLRTNWRSSPST